MWQNKEGQKVVETNYAANLSWNWNSYPTENLVDGDRNTLIHTNYAATEQKPLTFTIDMGSVKPVNRMVIYTQYRGGNGDWLCPRQMTLEGSTDGSNFFLVSESTNDVRNTVMTFDFAEKSFRYYRLTVTKSDRLLIISEIEMWRMLEINGGTLISPDDSMFKYKGKWYGAQANSYFGHVRVGKKGASVTFEFTGTRLAILSNKAYGGEFEVKIDKKKVSSIGLKKDSSSSYASYISSALKNKKHKVTIKCKDLSSIDAFVIYP